MFLFGYIFIVYPFTIDCLMNTNSSHYRKKCDLHPPLSIHNISAVTSPPYVLTLYQIYICRVSNTQYLSKLDTHVDGRIQQPFYYPFIG